MTMSEKAFLREMYPGLTLEEARVAYRREREQNPIPSELDFCSLMRLLYPESSDPDGTVR